MFLRPALDLGAYDCTHNHRVTIYYVCLKSIRCEGPSAVAVSLHRGYTPLAQTRVASHLVLVLITLELCCIVVSSRTRHSAVVTPQPSAYYQLTFMFISQLLWYHNGLGLNTVRLCTRRCVGSWLHYVRASDACASLKPARGSF